LSILELHYNDDVKPLLNKGCVGVISSQ